MVLRLLAALTVLTIFSIESSDSFIDSLGFMDGLRLKKSSCYQFNTKRQWPLKIVSGATMAIADFKWNEIFEQSKKRISSGYNEAAEAIKTARSSEYKISFYMFDFTLVTIAAFLLYKGCKRVKTVGTFKESMFNKPMRGIAIKVNDSDNLRFYHLPWLLSWIPYVKSSQRLSKTTMNVRLAGIDAPEVERLLM